PQEALGSEARPPEQLPPSNSVNPPVQPSPSAAPRPPLPEGFEPLAITCPCAPSVVFATDQSGSLHAVTSAATLADLVAAIGWAQQHAAMLPGDSPVKGHVLVGDIHSASVLGAGPWPVHLVIDGPQGPQVLPAQTQPLSQGPSGTTVPGWPSTT
ncbi:MAG: hypothetical protein MK101_10030, partial [Phycisphaerales bacterium]|nr:hypothetical protein [Phycisphaerales bacterium]